MMYNFIRRLRCQDVNYVVSLNKSQNEKIGSVKMKNIKIKKKQ